MPDTTTLLALLGAAFVLVDVALRIAALGIIPAGRKPSTGVAWLLLVLLAPAFGLIAFAFFGSARLGRRRETDLRRINATIAERTAPLHAVAQPRDVPAYVASAVHLNHRARGLIRQDLDRELGGDDVLHEAEVENLRRAVRSDHDVFGLEIAMDDAGRMRRGETVSDTGRDRKKPAQRNRLSDGVAQRFATDQFHDQPRLAAGRREIMNGDDVAMIQGRRAPGLSLESRQALAVAQQFSRQDFDSHLSPEARVARAIDLPHSAGADRGGDLIGAEARPCFEAHGMD